MATKWTDENARFRSCIVRKSDNFVISQGFKKFVNWGEKPDFQPWDNDWKFEARHKLDGSLLIISKYKGELIIRTRGTVDARQLDNGHEIDLLIEKYPKLFGFYAIGNYSILCEWTTPNNVIVLREHNEPTMTLVGMVHNLTGGYESQFTLDQVARVMGVNRPEKYEYASVEECIMDVKAWVGKEGVVLYSPDGQTLKKIKADLYLELHKVSTGYTNINQVLDLFMTTPRFPDWKDFYTYVETTLDYEVAEKLCGHIGKISDSYKLVLEKIVKIRKVVDMVRGPSFTRKDQAMVITERWDDWQKMAAFQILDNREVDDRIIRKGIETYLLYD